MALGQTKILRLSEVVDTPEVLTVQQVYDRLRANCLTMLPKANCDGILPERYIYYAPDQALRIPGWLWALVGIGVWELIKK
jgi:hypothetical protein